MAYPKPQTTELFASKQKSHSEPLSDFNIVENGWTHLLLSVVQTSQPQTDFGHNFRSIDVQVSSARFVPIKCLFVEACHGH